LFFLKATLQSLCSRLKRLKLLKQKCLQWEGLASSSLARFSKGQRGKSFYDATGTQVKRGRTPHILLALNVFSFDPENNPKWSRGCRRKAECCKKLAGSSSQSLGVHASSWR
jgi:hypothetical protein